MIRFSRGRLLPRRRAAAFVLLSIGAALAALPATAQTAPDAGGNITATDLVGDPLAIQEDTVTRTDFRVSGINLSDAEGTPTQIRLTAVSGGTVTRSGGTAIAIGESGTGEALTLTGTMIDLEFVPASNRDTNATITYRVVDPAADPDSAASTITITITPVNDAPTISAGTLAAVAEDATNPAGASVTSLFGGSFSDPDTNPASSLEGIAVTGDPANAAQGAWQFSPKADGQWFPVTPAMATSLSDTNALYLSAATLIRFVPTANFDGAVTPLTVHALDNTNALAFSNNSGPNITRELNDVSSNGGSTPISASAVNLNTSITPSNDAPSAANATLAAIDEDTVNPPGATVSSLFGGSFSDPDTTPAPSLSGIAVVGDPVAPSQGIWQYSPDSGVNWFDVSDGIVTLSNSNALYLSAATRVRFVPAANFNAAVTGLTVRVLDNTNALAFSSNAGAVETRQLHDVTTNGGGTAISAATYAINTSINAVNDAPTISNATLAAVAEDTSNPPGATVSALFGPGFTDVDGALAGIAVVSDPDNASQGSWQYAPDGTNWFDVSSGAALSNTNALYLSAATSVRFLPALNYAGAVSPLTVRGIDTSNALAFSSNSGASEQRETHDVSTSGSPTPISAGTALLNTSLTAQNDDPTFAMFPGAQAVNEDTDLFFNDANANRIVLADVDIGASDIRATLDVSNGTLTLSGTAGLTAVSGNGTANVSLDGSLSEVNQALNGLRYRATLNYNGPDTLDVTINDLGHTGAGGGGDVMMSAAITVNAVNDAPTFAQFPGAQAVNEDTNLVFNDGNANRIQFADVDLGANDMRATLSVTNGALTLATTVGLSSVTGNGTGTVVIEGPLTPVNNAVNGLIYRGTLNYFGADTLQVAINDLGNTGSGGGTDVNASAGITVNAVNDPPTQVTNSALVVNQGAGALVSAARLTYTDVDDDDATLVYTVVTPPANGSINLGASFTQGDINSSAVTYTHDGSGTTSDSFVFNVRDDDLATSSNATFNITVNQRPTVVSPIADVSVNENAANTVFSVSANFSDPEAGPLTFTVQSVTNGGLFSATPSFSGSTLTIPYAPNSPGIATITVRATDSGSAFVEDTFTVSVNDAPVANDDPGFSTPEDTAVIIDVLLNDTDLTASGAAGTLDPATVTVVAPPANGMTSVNPANGRITYTPNGDFNGADTFTYTVRDTNTPAATSNAATVSVTVDPANDPPALNVPGATQPVNEGDTLTFSLSNGNAILVDDVDADETALPAGGVRVTLVATKGTLALATMAGLVNVSGNNTANVVFDGTVNGATTALNGLVYTPSPLENGAATVSVTLSDKGNTGAGGILTDNGVIDIQIASVNDAPIVTVPGPQNVNEDVTTGIAGVSIADPDAGSGNLTVTLSVGQGQLGVNAAAAGGVSAGNISGNNTNTLTLTGTLTQLNNTLPTLTYRTALNLVTAQTITVLANDNGNTGGPAETDSDTIAVTVTSQNDNPTFANFPGAAQNVNEDTNLQFSTANANRITLADVDIEENNPGGEIRAILTVSSGILTPNGMAGLSTATGYGTGSVTLQGPLASVNTALNGLTYRGNLNFNGADTLTATINDLGNTGAGGGGNIVQAVTINVVAQNDAPVITVPAPQTVDEDTNLAFSAADSNAITVTDADADEAPGDLVVTLAVSSGTLTLASTAALTSNTGNGTASISMTGSLAAIDAALDGLVYRANTQFNGADTLNITANDQGNTGAGGAGMDAESLSITVGAVNDAPQLTLPGAQTINEDTTATIPGISVTDVDAGMGNLVVSLSVVSGRLRVSDTISGGVPALAIGNNNTSAITLTGTLGQLNITLPTLTFTSALNNRNNQTLSVSVDDQGNTGSGGNQVAAGAVALNITAINDNPVLTLPGTQSIDEDTSLIFSTSNANALSVNDVDVAETPGQLRVTLGVTNGRLTLGTTAGITLVTGTGVAEAGFTFAGTVNAINTALDGLTYQPDAHFNTEAGASEALSVTVNDQGFTGLGGGGDIAGSVTINIAGVNDDPVLTVPGAQAVDEDTDLTFAGSISVADLDLAETPGGALRVQLSANEGAFTLASTAGLAIEAPATGAGDAAIAFTGDAAAVNGALNGLRYRGDQDFNGGDTLSITVNDQGNTGQGGGGDIAETIAVTVAPVNDAPVASNALISPAEPLRSEDLVASYTFSDVDGDAESGTTIRWFRDGVLQAAFNDLTTVPMSATIEEEVWLFRVTPSDGLLAGAELESNEVRIRPVANVQVSISRDPLSAVPGEPITYTIQVRNLGPSPVGGASVTAAIPAALQDATWACADCGTSGNGAINETIDLASGQTVEYRLTALVDPSATGDLVFTASANGPALVFETDPSDNTDTDTVPLQPEATLAATISSDRASAQPGDTITYTFTATNNGPSDARGVRFTDAPDANTALVVGSVTTSAGSVARGNGAGDSDVDAEIGTIPLGTTVTVRYSATVAAPFPAGGMRQVCTRGLFYGLAGDPDVNFVDAQPPAEQCTTIESVITVSATLVDALQADANANGEINPGDTVRYTVRIVNSGDGGANTVVYASPAIPNANLVVDSIMSTPATAGISTDAGSFTLTLDRLEGLDSGAPGGNEALITFDVNVRNPISFGESLLTSQGAVTFAEQPAGSDAILTDDPGAVVIPDSDAVPVDGEGNIVRPAPTVTRVVAAPQLVVRKADDIARNEEKRPGDTISYTVTIENRGNQGASELVYRIPFRDGEISEAELQQVDAASPLSDIAAALLTNFNALDTDNSDGLSAQELQGSLFALTPAQFNEVDFSDARLSLIEDSITVDGAPAANEGTATALELSLGTLNGRNPLFTNGPIITVGYAVQLQPVLRQGVSVIRSQGALSSAELDPVLSDDPESINTPGDATLTSVRAIPELLVDPEILTIDFGDQDIDDGRTAARMVTLTNAANATANLTFGFVGLEGASLREYVITSDSREMVLRPGQSRTIEIAFDPDAIGNKIASLRVESDDPDDGAVDINLSGRALDSDIRVTPTALNFGKRNLLAGPTNPQSVSIINDGLGILTLDSVTLTCGPDVFPVMTATRFDALDLNGDGVLTQGIGPRRELELAVDLFDLAESILDAFGDLDADSSNDLDPNEVDARFPFLTPERFSGLDADGSGELGAAELDAAMQLAMFAEQLLTSFEDFDTAPPAGLDFSEGQSILPDLTEAQFAELDADGNGVMSTAELEERRRIAEIARQLQADLDGLDADRNGSLSSTEIDTYTPPLTPGRFAVLDADASGELSLAELEASDSSLAAGIAATFGALDTDASGGLTIMEVNASCAFQIFSDSGEDALETAQSRLVRIVFNPSTEGVKTGTLRIEANQTGAGTPIVSKVSLAGIGNRTPRITGQNPVATREDTPVTIILDNLIVDAPLLAFPEEVTLAFQPRPADANYTRDGNDIIPNRDFNGVLFVPVTVRDGNIDSNIWNLRIDVRPENDPPTDIRLSNNTVLENQVLDTVIGRLTTTDPDIGDLHIYTLVPDDPLTDDDDHIGNEFFGIVADQLVTRAVFDFETQNRYTVLVRSRDPEGDTTERAFQIEIVDQANDEDNSVAAEVLLDNFGAADADGDGVITFDETLRLLPGFTQERFDTLNTEVEVSLADLERGANQTGAAQSLFDNFDQTDGNRNGALTLIEAQRTAPTLTPEAFAYLDFDGSGTLSPSELQAGILVHNDLSALVAGFESIDADDSARLTFDELPEDLRALNRDLFERLASNAGLSRRELENQVTCMLVEGSAVLIEPTGDLLAPPGASLLEVTFNAEADVNVASACSADDIVFTYDIAAESILLTDLAEYFLQNQTALDADFNGLLSEAEVAPSRIGLTPERFAALDFNGDGALSTEELEAAVILSDLAGILLDEFAALNTDNSTGLSFAETIAAGIDLDTLRYGILDLNGNGVLTREELEAEADLPGFLLAGFASLDANASDGLSLAEVRTVLPGLSQTRFVNLDADLNGEASAEELAGANDFEKAFPVFAELLPDALARKQIRGNAPATFTLPVNNAYRVRVTATIPETGQSIQSDASTFEIRNGVDSDENGYLDFPFEDLVNDGSRWVRSVSSANCNRRVLMHAWRGSNIPGRNIEAALANPANPQQLFSLVVPHGLAAEGEEAILIAAIACDAESLFTRSGAEGIGAPPEDFVAGTAWLSVNVIVREAGAPTFAPVSDARLAQRPITLSLNRLSFSPEDDATFYHFGTEIVSDDATGFDVVPGESAWSNEGVTNPAAAGNTLTARVARQGAFVALESLKPPILVSVPDISVGVNLGEVRVNETVEIPVTISNIGGERLIGAVELRDPSGVFSIIGDASYNLGHGESHQFLVRFAPNAEAAFAATLAYSGDPKGLIVTDVRGIGLPPKGFGCGAGSAGSASPWSNVLVIAAALAVLLYRPRRRSGVSMGS